MKIGVCTGVENIKKVEAMGFDYIEPSVVSIAKMTEEEFQKTLELVNSCKIKCEAFNVLFPGDIKVVGPEVDVQKIKQHLSGAFKRISMLGAKAVVFGSGGARKCPEGWDMKKAWEQIVEAEKIVGDEAAKYGLTIVIEPLNTSETNTINSVADGYKLAKEVNHPNVKLLADFYHMRRENEDMKIIVEAGSVLKHLHIANSNGRVYPLEAAEDQYEGFFSALKKIGYADRLSIEGRTENFDKDAPAGLAFLRSMAK